MRDIVIIKEEIMLQSSRQKNDTIYWILERKGRLINTAQLRKSILNPFLKSIVEKILSRNIPISQVDGEIIEYFELWHLFQYRQMKNLETYTLIPRHGLKSFFSLLKEKIIKEADVTLEWKAGINILQPCEIIISFYEPIRRAALSLPIFSSSLTKGDYIETEEILCKTAKKLVKIIRKSAKFSAETGKGTGFHYITLKPRNFSELLNLLRRILFLYLLTELLNTINPVGDLPDLKALKKRLKFYEHFWKIYKPSLLKKLALANMKLLYAKSEIDDVDKIFYRLLEKYSPSIAIEKFCSVVLSLT